ncbi:MAG: hypothetical protein E7006_02055 [Alphaproteobacteria bacterium]|nr:hypothetical protein [Alphaproteobacteria bacterium]
MQKKVTNSAAQQLFHEYIMETSKKFISSFGPAYMFQHEVRNRWRNEIPYSEKAEDFLVYDTRLFLRLLNDKNPNSTNPVFLKSLINLIVDYLSAYTMRAPGRTRNAAKKILKDKLWDNNPYIQNMLARQAQTKQERKHRTPQTVAKKRKLEAKKQAAVDKEVAQDVREEFRRLSEMRKFKKGYLR